MIQAFPSRQSCVQYRLASSNLTHVRPSDRVGGIERMNAPSSRESGEPAEHREFAVVLKMSGALSGEVDLDKLIHSLMSVVVEHAGARRGLLLLIYGDKYVIEAEATTSDGGVAIDLRHSIAGADDLPKSILDHVIRTGESVFLHDASTAHPFAGDSYIHRRRTRSVLCMPLSRHGKLIGTLYLENNSAFQSFTPDRLATLKLIASEAAISLENARLYADLREREAKARLLVETSLDAVLSMDEQGRITEWNARAEEMFGWRRDEVVGKLLSETLIPKSYRSTHEQGLRRFLTSGVGPILNQRVEITALRRSGDELPVELSVAPYRVGDAWAFSGFVRDITERKRAEASMRRFREMETELAHANRVGALGQMSASIAHEVRQPISAAITNAHVALRWLEGEPPDLEKVRRALNRIVSNGDRASEVVDRVRAFVKKSPLKMDGLELNDTLADVVEFIRGEAANQEVNVHTQLGRRLPVIDGDRVQLQQVMLNLMLNGIEAMRSIEAAPRVLSVSTRRSRSDCALIAVRDSGPGLLKADLERVFEPFYTTKADGLGLGLSICRSIIEAHGGHLWATANRSAGATFRIELPQGLGVAGRPAGATAADR
jgi:PAS domain S-box-containing protein